MLAILHRFLIVQIIATVVAALVIGAIDSIFIKSGTNWLIEPLVALVIAMTYVSIGLAATQLRSNMTTLIVRHLFRTFLCGAMLALAPIWLTGQVSLAVICIFMLVHWCSWWWIFGRKGAFSRSVLLECRPPAQR